jgi:probable HAF family extracellular repeat protein
VQAPEGQPSQFISGQAINDLGHVVGQGAGPTNRNAFLWSRSQGMRDLGVLPGFQVSIGFALNNADIVTGTNRSLHISSAFVWRESTGMQPLVNQPDTFNSEGTGINEFGQIVGFKDGAGGGGFLWDRINGLQPVVVMGAVSTLPEDINNVGKVVGFGFRLDQTAQDTGFVIDARTAQQRFLPLVTATAINDLGQIAGIIGERFAIHAAVWDRLRGVRDLGTLHGFTFSEANDINNVGTIVGRSAEVDVVRGFVWDEHHGMRDLNDLIDRSGPSAQSIEINDARGINNFGWIIANGRDTQAGPDGPFASAFVLIPIADGGKSTVRRCNGSSGD